MSDKYCLRFNGGPFPGTRVFDDDGTTWPPEERLFDPEGRGEYRRVGYSELGPTDPKHHVIRGAEYDWFPADHTP